MTRIMKDQLMMLCKCRKEVYIIIYTENYAGHCSTGNVWIELSWKPWQIFFLRPSRQMRM